MTLGVAVVGVGLIGQRRASVIHQDPHSRLVAVADVNEPRAAAVAQEFGCVASGDWRQVVCREDVDAVVVSTVNKSLAPVAVHAATHGKHVLCEKPLGRSLSEATQIVEAADASGVCLKAGFSLRFHPGIRAAHQAVTEGLIGRPQYVRGAYGHGGRPGYDKEWRGDADLAGGGELLDQGVHLADLCRWFLGEFDHVAGATSRGFWDIAPLEDNGFALLTAADGRVATFHTSWMQWKNRFLFEVIGTEGYAVVEGLGGSYGVERLTVGRRNLQGGSPSEETTPFDGPDTSWRDEWLEFTTAIRMGRPPLSSGRDALRTMQVVDAIYRAAGSRTVTTIA